MADLNAYNTDTPEEVALLCLRCTRQRVRDGQTVDLIWGYDLGDLPPEHQICEDCGI